MDKESRPIPRLGSEWTFAALEQYDKASGRIAAEYRLDC